MTYHIAGGGGGKCRTWKINDRIRADNGLLRRVRERSTFRHRFSSVPYGHNTFCAACEEVLTGMGRNCPVFRSRLTWFCNCTTKNFTVVASLAFIVPEMSTVPFSVTRPDSIRQISDPTHPLQAK